MILELYFTFFMFAFTLRDIFMPIVHFDLHHKVYKFRVEGIYISASLTSLYCHRPSDFFMLHIFPFSTPYSVSLKPIVTEPLLSMLLRYFMLNLMKKENVLSGKVDFKHSVSLMCSKVTEFISFYFFCLLS